MAQGITYDGIPLTITNVSDSNAVVAFRINGGLPAPLLYYKKGDGKTYKKWKYNNITLQPQESIDIFGDNPSGFSKSQIEYAKFDITGGAVSIGGRISALSATMVNFMFYNLFNNCSVANIDEDLFEGIDTLKDSCFRSMFQYCTRLTDVPANLLPFTALSQYCYYLMFANTNLTKIKSGFLPATSVPINAYGRIFASTKINTIEQNAIAATSVVYAERMFSATPIDENSFQEGSLKKMTSNGNGSFTRMFESCKFSKIPPQIQLEARHNYNYQNTFENNKQLIELDSTVFNSLNITGSGARLYGHTFNGCTSLQKVEIPFNQSKVKGHDRLFQYTFNGCSSLNEIKVHFTSWQYQASVQGVPTTFNLTEEWLAGVSPTGTFICPKELAEATDGYYDEEGNFVPGVGRGSSTVPEGWTIDFPIIDARDGDTNAMALMAVISQQAHADGTPWVKDSLVMMKSEAEKVEDIGTVFRENGDITDFKALQYFTGLTVLQANAFYRCFDLEKIILPNTIKELKNYCLSYIYALKALIIPDSVEIVGQYVTSSSYDISYLHIGRNVKSIEYRAFVGLRNADTIVVDSANTTYDSRDNCNAIIVSSTNELICGCPKTSIPDTVTSIGGWAFNLNQNFTSLTIPKSVIKSVGYAFDSTSQLKTIYYGGTLKDWFNINFTSSYANPFRGKTGVSLIIDGENVISETMNIPEGVTSVGTYVFPLISDIKHIIIPSSVNSWSTESFYNNSLESIVVNNTNTKYDSREGCNAIVETASNKLVYACKNTIIPNSVTAIGHSAFRYTTVSSTIEIPESVNTIDNFAFNKSNIDTIKINVETPPKLGGTNVFASATIIYVPDNFVETYKAANLWSALADRIKPISELP